MQTHTPVHMHAYSLILITTLTLLLFSKHMFVNEGWVIKDSEREKVDLVVEKVGSCLGACTY